MIPELSPVPARYVCGHNPACSAEMMVNPADTRIPMHNCPTTSGMTMPMVREGERVKVTLNERQDYIGGEVGLAVHQGRPIMSVTTTRDDGEDVAVYAPTAL